MRNRTFGVLNIILFCLVFSSGLKSQEIGLARIRNAKQLITVGGPDADVPGFTSQAIQLALDAIKEEGEGLCNLIRGHTKLLVRYVYLIISH